MRQRDMTCYILPVLPVCWCQHRVCVVAGNSRMGASRGITAFGHGIVVALFLQGRSQLNVGFGGNTMTHENHRILLMLFCWEGRMRNAYGYAGWPLQRQHEANVMASVLSLVNLGRPQYPRT